MVYDDRTGQGKLDRDLVVDNALLKPKYEADEAGGEVPVMALLSDGGVIKTISKLSDVDYAAIPVKDDSTLYVTPTGKFYIGAVAISGGGGGTGTGWAVSIDPAWAALPDAAPNINTLITALASVGVPCVIAHLGGQLTVSTINMASNVYLFVMGGSYKAKANMTPATNNFDFRNVSRCGILGHLFIDGNKANQPLGGTFGTDGYGQDGISSIGIGPGSSDIFIDSVHSLNPSLDGLYVGPSGTAPKNIHIRRLKVDGGNRNGFSITNGDDITIDYAEVCNSGVGVNGAAPRDGFDIEPNLTTDKIRVSIGKLVTYNNAGSGGAVICQITGAEPYLVHGPVTIGEFVSHDNTLAGIKTHKVKDFSILSGDIYNNAGDGVLLNRDLRRLRINNCKIYNNGGRGINGALNQQDFASSDWDFDGCVIYNNSQATPNNSDGIRLDSDSASFVLSRVKGHGLKLFDDQASMTQRYGWSAGADVKGINFQGHFPVNATGRFLSTAALSYVEQSRASITATVTPGAVAAGSYQNCTISMPGVTNSWRVDSATCLSGLEAGLSVDCVWTATDMVFIRVGNKTAGSITGAGKTWRVVVSAEIES